MNKDIDWQEIATAVKNLRKIVLEKIKTEYPCEMLSVISTSDSSDDFQAVITANKKHSVLKTPNAAIRQITATETILLSAEEIGLERDFIKASIPASLKSEKMLDILKNNVEAPKLLELCAA